MHDALLVDVLQSGRDLGGHQRHLRRIERPRAELVRQGRAGHELHDEERQRRPALIAHARVEDRDQTGMLQAGQRAHLRVDAPLVDRRAVSAERLDRHRPPQHLIIAAEHVSHAPTAYPLEQPIPAAEHSTRAEPARHRYTAASAHRLVVPITESSRPRYRPTHVLQVANHARRGLRGAWHRR